jgi:MFS family permease
MLQLAAGDQHQRVVGVGPFVGRDDVGRHKAAAAAFALLHGAAWGLRGPFMQAIRADYFGRRSIGMIMGLSAVIIAIGQVGGPMIAGGFADLTGDYRTGFTVLALLAASGSVVFAVATPPARPRRPADGAAEPSPAAPPVH